MIDSLYSLDVIREEARECKRDERALAQKAFVTDLLVVADSLKSP